MGFGPWERQMLTALKNSGVRAFEYLPFPFQRFLLHRVFGIGDPYKPYCDIFKAIFIRLPKTGSQSIEEALLGHKIGHSQLWLYRVFDPVRFATYFKFGFVRNPWDRVVSAYTFLKNGGRNATDHAWAQRYLAGMPSFESFVLALRKQSYRRAVLQKQHFVPQYKFVCDHQGNILADFIGRFESLPEDYAVIAKQLGVQAELPHINRSKRGHYRDYYNKTTQSITADIYRDDIEIFGYSF